MKKFAAEHSVKNVPIEFQAMLHAALYTHYGLKNWWYILSKNTYNCFLCTKFIQRSVFAHLREKSTGLKLLVVAPPSRNIFYAEPW